MQTIEHIPLGQLVPFDRNARTHSKGQIEQVVAAINRWGWTNPILIDDHNGIIAGHARHAAATILQLETVPCIRISGLSDAEKRALVLADNKIALNAGWDEDLLAQELEAIGDLATLTGFSDLEVERMLKGHAGLTDPDAVPEPPEDPWARRGDVFVLGQHRLICGDSTSPDDVAALLGAVKPHLMVTDPPYGVDYDASWRDGVDLNLGKKLGEKGSGRSLGVVQNDDRANWREAWDLFPGHVAYVWSASLNSIPAAEGLIAAGFVLRAQIIWAKQIPVFSRGDYHWQHEPCWYAVRKGKTGKWTGDRSQTTIWQIQNNNRLGGAGEKKTGHSTQKPVECMARPMRNNSSPGQVVYDPFIGSGSSIIAAEMLGRACYGIEISPAYVDVAIRRWQEFTGQQAVLEATGEPFDDLGQREQAA